MGQHKFYAAYLLIAKKESLSLGYVARLSRRLQLFSELKGQLVGFSDTLFGFRMMFMEGMITGSLSTSGKATSIYKHVIE